MAGAEMRTYNSDKGFSLIEVMIALVVLLVGILGIMGMQYYAVSGNKASREMRMATNLGQDMIEALKSTAYTDLAPGNDTPATGSALSGGVAYERRWWVVSNCLALTLAGDDNTCTTKTASCASVPDGSTTAPVTAIRTRTCWNDKAGNVHSVTMDSLRWNRSVYY